MKNKRFSLIFASFVLLISLSGCGVFKAQPTNTPYPTFKQPTCARFPTREPISSIPATPPAGKPIINITYQFKNVPYTEGETGDFAPDSERYAYTWAVGTIMNSYKVYSNGDGTYEVYEDDEGTFTTLKGKSPAGTGTVDAGIAGTYSLKEVERISDTLLSSPKKPLNGNLGSADFHGTSQGGVTGDDVLGPWSYWYFSSDCPDDLVDFLYEIATYTTCGNGTYTEAWIGWAGFAKPTVTGDITGTAAICSSS